MNTANAPAANTWRALAAACERPVGSEGERLRTSMLGAAGFTLAAHGFSFFTFMPQHDALIESYWQSTDWVISLGRFLLPVYMRLRGYMAMPWTAGMLTMLFFGLSVYFVTRSLRMDTRAEILLTAGFFSANFCVLAINSLFQFALDAYICSLLFACMGVWLVSDRPGLREALLAAVCFFISVGIYTAFITAALCLFMVLALQEAADRNGLPREFWKKLGVWALTLAAAAAAYFVASRLALSAAGVTGADKNTSVFSMGALSAGDIVHRLGVNYYFFTVMHFLGFSPVHHADYLGVGAGVMSSLLAVLCIVSFCREHAGTLKKGIYVLFVLVAGLFPFVSRLVPLLTGNGNSYHTMFAQYLVQPVLLWLFFRRAKPSGGAPRRAAAVLAAVALSLGLIGANIRYSNEAYTLQQVIYDRTLYHTGRVIEDPKEAGYDRGAGDKVVLSGTFELNSDLDRQLGQYIDAGFAGFNDTSVTYAATFRSAARLLGYTVSVGSADQSADPEAVRALLETMPAYPAEGYVREIDGFYLVRLS